MYTSARPMMNPPAMMAPMIESRPPMINRQADARNAKNAVAADSRPQLNEGKTEEKMPAMAASPAPIVQAMREDLT